MNEEIWKDVPNYEGIYQASNLGRIRSFPRKGTHTKEINILKQNTKNSKHYCHCTLTKNGKSKTVSVHRIIALTFIPNPNSLPQVNHKDGNKENNNIENLEWCTNEYNMKHSWEKGLRKPKRGSEHFKSKKVNQYDLDGNFIKTWFCIRKAQDELKIPNQNIIKVCQGKRNSAGGYKWKYV